MLKTLFIMLLILLAACKPENIVDQRFKSYVDDVDDNLKIDFRQIRNCQMRFETKGMFILKEAKSGVFLLPESISKDDYQELDHVETNYGTFGVKFNRSLPKIIKSPEWINMLLTGLAQKSNDRTDSYYISRFFSFSVSHSESKEVFVSAEKKIFIMKSSNKDSVQVFFFFLQPEVVSLQSFDIKHDKYDLFMNDLGVKCESN